MSSRSFLRTPRRFSAENIETLSSLGGLAGVAVHNALVYKHKYDIARCLEFEMAPKAPVSAEGLEVGHKFIPAREVGGDYYDFINIAPGALGIAFGDVSGKSVPAAMYTSMGRHVLRAYALENHPPSEVIRRLNRIACESMATEFFISLFYGVFDAEKRTFRYASGGHEPPLLYRPDGSVERLTAAGILVGITPDADYGEREVALEPGSILVLFTDGVIDSHATQRQFNAEEMRKVLAESYLKPAQELADNIHERLTELAGSRVQDDIALVILKVL